MCYKLNIIQVPTNSYLFKWLRPQASPHLHHWFDNALRRLRVYNILISAYIFEKPRYEGDINCQTL